MKIEFSKILTLFLISLILSTNHSLASNNPYPNETNNAIYLQNILICSPFNLTNNILAECLTYSIYGLDDPNENLDNNDYIYDEELNIYWLKQGISLHLIFYNESYDLGIRNITYDEFIDFRDLLEQYAYDHEENRIKKIDYDYSTGINTSTYYISDNFIQVRLTNGTILNETYYYANGKLVASKDNSGNKQYYHPDHLGSTTLVTNQSGDIVEEEFYLPFGEIYSGSENSRHLFTGKELDKLSDLYYYGARYYNPEFGFFLTGDDFIADIYNPQNLNRYSYVLNNPYKYTDKRRHFDVGIEFYNRNL